MAFAPAVPLRGTLLALSLAALPGAVAGAQSTAPEDAVRHVTLDNGLLVVVVENHTVPLATLNVVVRNGAYTQADDEQGTAHLFEHMLFQGYQSGTQRPFGYDAAMIKASYNGVTSAELVAYYLTLPSEKAGDGVALLARLMRSTRFDAKTLGKERTIVFDELNRNASEPDYQLMTAVEQQLWGTGYPRKNVGGTVIDLMRATPKRLTELFERFYVPNNAALVITGDVSADHVFAQAREHFGKWKRGADPFADGRPTPPPALEMSEGVLVGHDDAPGATVLVSFQGPSAGPDRLESHAMRLFATLVNDPASGMQDRLVESGLFESLFLSYESLAMGGALTLRGRTSAEQLQPALEALKSEVEAFGRETYFTADELIAAKRRSAVSRALQAERMNVLGMSIARAWSSVDLDHWLQEPQITETTDAAALHYVASRYLTNQPRVIGVMMTPALAAEQQSVLAKFLETGAGQ